MKVYTPSKARQHLATLLKEASREGRVQIRRRDGMLFEVSPVEQGKSALDVPGLSTDISTGEIVAIVRASRKRAPAPRRSVRRAHRPTRS